VLYHLSRVLGPLTDAETGQRGYVVTGEDRYLEPYRSAESLFAEGRTCVHIDALRGLTKDNPAQQERVNALERLARERLANLAATITLRRDKGPEAARARILTDVGKRIMDDIRNLIAKMQVEEQQLLQRLQARQAARLTTTFITLAAGIVMILLTSGLVIWRTSRDITDRRRAAELLRKAHTEVEQLFNAAVPLWAIDTDHNVLRVNDVFCSFFGMGSQEVLGAKCDHIWRGPVCNTPDCPMAKIVGGAEQGGYEFDRRLGDGSTVSSVVTAVPYRGPHGELIGIVESFSDVTALKQAQEALQKAHDELERRVKQRTAELAVANKELEAFAYSVSHDLRSPLRGMDGFSAAFLEEYGEKLDEQGRDYLARVRAAAGRMSDLIDDLLGLSRINRVEMKCETVDLSVLAKQIAADVQAGAPDRRVTFRIAGGLTASGDRGLLRVALEKLIDNAWKFTSRHPTAGIEFGIADVDNGRALFVRDDGAGFDMAYADKLFGPFQRLHSLDEFPGTGIGLATAQRIIHRHGGSIWARAEVEKGATFYFTLP